MNDNEYSRDLFTDYRKKETPRINSLPDWYTPPSFEYVPMAATYVPSICWYGITATTSTYSPIVMACTA